MKIGESAPNFTGTNQNGKTISLSDYKGKKLVIYFYPKDNTPACTAQACSLRDHNAEIKKAGIEILGVSMDSEKKHQQFITKFSLPFDLIVDEERKVIDAFGVWGEKKFMGRVYDGIIRTTFLIDEKGIIRGIINKPKTKIHGEEIINFEW
jgi:peroxiredoxin Q/BCP